MTLRDAVDYLTESELDLRALSTKYTHLRGFL